MIPEKKKKKEKEADYLRVKDWGATPVGAGIVIALSLAMSAEPGFLTIAQLPTACAYSRGFSLQHLGRLESPPTAAAGPRLSLFSDPP